MVPVELLDKVPFFNQALQLQRGGARQGDVFTIDGRAGYLCKVSPSGRESPSPMFRIVPATSSVPPVASIVPELVVPPAASMVNAADWLSLMVPEFARVKTPKLPPIFPAR